MKIVKTIDEARAALKDARIQNKKVGFVPTMGYLHDGHISLVDKSKELSDFQVMSIFVNRMQFNDPKDYDTYPRELERDFAIAEKNGVDLIFIPDDREMYRNCLTSVSVDNLTDNLCGAHRPGHFTGVFTVVSKLFNIVQPDIAVFGQKDIQQAVSIEKMVFDLNFPVKIVIAPIVREADGLAMSSRNKHLSEEQRGKALVLSRSLGQAAKAIREGERDALKIHSLIMKVIQEGSPDSVDYISIVDYSTLSPVDIISKKGVVAVAANFGTTRLIDNMIVAIDESGVVCI